MKVITVAASKGGTGKSTLSAMLAVRAAEDGKASMIDMNVDQGSLTQWARVRRTPNPRLITDVRSLMTDVRMLRQAEILDWLVIDTPPLAMKTIEAAIAVSDVVVIPVRPSAIDIGVIEPVVEICRKRRKPHGFVLMACLPQRRELADSAEKELATLAPVLGRIADRPAHIEAIARGKVGHEVDKTLRPEVNRLWDAIVTLAGDDA